MPQVLQLGVELNSPVSAKLTGPDIPLPDNVAEALQIVVAFLDQKDAKPGDGDVEIAESYKIRLPLIGNVNEKGDFFLHLKTV